MQAPSTIRMPLVAPTIIPDEIPVVTNEPVVLEELPALPAEVDSGEQGGVAGGVEEGGEVGGTVGGVADVKPEPPPNPDVVQVKRDDPLPVGAIAQEFPAYPDFALKRNWEDTLVVRYVIGKNGRVREVAVITPPEREEFSREAVSKIRHWRFHPYRDAEGQPKEVVHELTVNFRIVRKTPGAR
jgi:TonB family protein